MAAIARRGGGLAIHQGNQFVVANTDFVPPLLQALMGAIDRVGGALERIHILGVGVECAVAVIVFPELEQQKGILDRVGEV